MNEVLLFENLKSELEQKEIFTSAYLGVLYESCITCCEQESKHSGSILKSYKEKENLYKKNLTLVWENGLNDNLKKTYNDSKKATENGSVFLTLGILNDLFPEYDDIETSEGNNGIDYWLSSKANELDFSKSARLEVSGIRKKSSSNNIQRRLKIKNKQTERSDNTNLPVYISIIEYSELEAIFVKK